MRYVRHIEDEWGSLVDIAYYCCRLCYVEEPDPEVAAIEGGWWPCLDSELSVPEPCRVCGEFIGLRMNEPAEMESICDCGVVCRSADLSSRTDVRGD